jgi:D-alanyl-D-alanine carboxypeptidase
MKFHFRPGVDTTSHATLRLRKCALTGMLAAIVGGYAAPLQATELDSTYRARLLSAYSEFIKAIDGNQLVWKDGTKSALDDGQGVKAFDAWLANPDIEDMFQQPYAAGDVTMPPAKESDPGRARNEAFFNTMYGDCRKGETDKQLVDVVWLPTKSGKKIKFAKANGAAAALAAVSKELDALPATFDQYLFPSAGTFVCRTVAGTNRVSAHGHGIAIDIATKRAHYWRWAEPGRDGPVAYKNEIPMEIVRVFEKHGFIWGGKWHHYDTMHFEYRPELMPPEANTQGVRQ